MGAHDVMARFEGSLSKTELQKAFREMQEALTIEYGTNPYNGTFATCSGLIVDGDGPWASAEEAKEYALNKAQKWGPAVAVQVYRSNQVGDWTREWHVHGWAAS